MAKTPSPAPPAAPKRPLNIDQVIARIREAVAPYPKAALFDLYDEGHTTAFEILVACVLSIRTLDESMIVAARRLFERAPSPAVMAAMAPGEIDGLIRECAFHDMKAERVHAIARRVTDEWHGKLPCDVALMDSLGGVGPKCASLAAGIACGQAYIGVDTHVHRITNRWGYVQTRTPEETMAALEQKLPKRYWVEINKLLVPFGKHVCTARHPACPTCPVLDMCRQVGVTNAR